MRCDLFYWHFSRRWILSFSAVTLNWSGMASPWVNEQGFWKGRDFLLVFQIILRSPNAISQSPLPKTMFLTWKQPFSDGPGITCLFRLHSDTEATQQKERACSRLSGRTKAIHSSNPFYFLIPQRFMTCMSKYDLAYVFVMTLLRWYIAAFWHIVQTYSKANTANNQMLSSKILGSLSDLVQTNKIYHNYII